MISPLAPVRIRRPRRSRVRTDHWVSLALASLWIAGCGGGDAAGPTQPPPAAPRLTSVVITPASGTLFTSGETTQFSAAAFNNDGSSAAGRTFTWTSSDLEVATISATGLATAAGAPGRATISASTSGVTATATLDVAAGPQGGTFTAQGGAVKLTVPPGAVSSTVMVTITPVAVPPPESGLLTGAVFEFLPDGTTFDPPADLILAFDPATLPTDLEESELTLLTESEDGFWVELDGATVDSDLNTVTAAIDGFSKKGAGSFVFSIEIDPSAVDIEVGQTAALAPTLRDKLGTLLQGRDVRWSSSNQSIVRAQRTNSGTGLVTGVSPGTATITARSGRVEATAVVTVSVPAPLSITTSSPLANGTVGVPYSQTLAASGGDGNYTWALFNATTLPAGLVLNTATGVISGTPTAEGTTNFEVEVTSAEVMAQKALSITVNASWQIFFEDNFDGNTLDTSNWTQDEVTPPRPYSLTGSGELRIGGGEGDGPSLFYNTAISGNHVRVTTEFRTDVDDAIQDDVDMLIFLNVDPTGANGYALLLTSDPVGATRDYELKIIEIANNVPTVLSQASMGGTMPQIGPNTDYVLEGSNSNGTITFTVKDASGIVLKSLSVLDSSYSGGRIGIGGDLNVDAASLKSIFFDYVRVEKFQ